MLKLLLGHLAFMLKKVVDFELSIIIGVLSGSKVSMFI